MERNKQEDEEDTSEEEPSETEYEREGQVSRNSEDNTGSPDRANGKQRKPEVLGGASCMVKTSPKVPDGGTREKWFF